MTLEVRSISKRFGPVQANDGVDLSVDRGVIHAVLGENGAGKSTLMKILSGFQAADSGEVWLDGSRIELGSPRSAIEAGIGMLHQDPLVALPFTVLDNFVLGRRGRIDLAAARRELQEGAARLGFTLEPDATTRSLSVGERQQLEIVRLLALGVRVLILDEPTSGITTGQRESLFAALRRLVADGLIVLFVSHKLEEIEDLCHKVTVMRQGRVVGETDLPCPSERLVEMMFGRSVVLAGSDDHRTGQTVLSVRNLEVATDRRRIRDASIEIESGEIVGLAGLAGSGQRALMRGVAGLDRLKAGSVHLGSTDVTGLSYRETRELGVRYLAAGRLEEGLFPGLTITEHMALAETGDSRLIDWSTAEERAQRAIEEYHIVGRPDSPVESLSGGNQQRVLLAMLSPDLRLLLMEEPTRGLDIESADEVWSRIVDRARGGTAIIFASADLDELVRHCDRIAVCFDGRILDIVDTAEIDADRLGALIGGKVAT
jgi:simple sugar transport system ATP-binding protein